MREESMEEMVQSMQAQALIESKQEWRKWTKEIPFIPVKPDWMFKPLPPFGGAVARFNIGIGEAWVSVYLDCYDKLGWVGEPYWEVYPVKGDTYRCSMNDVDELSNVIDEALNEQLLDKESNE
jgi:hypothetical protein